MMLATRSLVCRSLVRRSCSRSRRPAAGAGRESPDPTAVTPDASADLAASRRLAQRLREVEGLQDVTVTVSGGVARLQGDVIDLGDRTLAEQVAGQQDGISAVDNQLALSTRLSDRFDTATQLAVDKLMRLVAALPLLVVAIAVVMLSWWLGKLVGARIGRRQWRSDNPYFASLLQRLAQWLTLLGGRAGALECSVLRDGRGGSGFRRRGRAGARLRVQDIARTTWPASCSACGGRSCPATSAHRQL